MASLPRANALTSAPVTVANSARVSAGLRGVASGGMVEELSTGQGVALDVGHFIFQEYDRPTDTDRQPQQDPNPHARYGSRFQTPSQAFAAMLEVPALQDSGRGGAVAGGGGRKGFAGLLSHAVSTYELNAKVISGSLEPRGTNFSFVL